MPEFNKLVRRIRHDEKLAQVFQVGLNDLGFLIHVAGYIRGDLYWLLLMRLQSRALSRLLKSMARILVALHCYNEFLMEESSSKEVSWFMKNPSLKMECSKRVKRLQELLGKKKVEGALIIQKWVVFYLTGTDENGLLWVPAGGKFFSWCGKVMKGLLQDVR